MLDLRPTSSMGFGGDVSLFERDLFHNFVDFKKALDRVWYVGLLGRSSEAAT